MDEKVLKLKTPSECESFILNAIARERPDLANQARERSIQLKSEIYGFTNEIEKACLQAIYAYEDILSIKNNRKTRATRTWQMISRYGLLIAVERAVNRKDESFGYNLLKELGLSEYTFESVVIKHHSSFSADSLKRAQLRISTRNA